MSVTHLWWQTGQQYVLQNGGRLEQVGVELAQFHFKDVDTSGVH